MSKHIEERIKKLEEAQKKVLNVLDLRVRLDYKRAKQKNLWFEMDNETGNKYRESEQTDALTAYKELDKAYKDKKK